MRLIKALVLLASGLTTGLSAFHNRGVGHCNGCHTMHNIENGALVDPDSPNGNPWLLKDDTPSDVCLSCHATSAGSLLSPSPLDPPPNKGGGNFAFLREDNLNDGSGSALSPIPGDAAGHNLHAPGHGLAPDATLARSPGGNYPTASMACTSCHDPHGNTNFRMLYGAGQIRQGNFFFSNPAPDALGLPVSDASAETNSSHTAYRGRMSEWCGNCHGNIHAAGSGGNLSFKHPTGKALGAGIAGIYNRYNGTSSPTGGSQATAYLAQIPFEDAAMTTVGTAGPSSGSRVMCLTCHRAHASSAPNAGRWDFNVTFLSEDGVQSGSYGLPNPYGNPGQRSLCNKCHGKDQFDANPL